MWTKVIHVDNVSELTDQLDALVGQESHIVDKALFVQAYLSSEHAAEIVPTIENFLPNAKIVGCTAFGMISIDGVSTNGISLFIMMLEDSCIAIRALRILPKVEAEQAYNSTKKTLNELTHVQGIQVLLPISRFNNEEVVSGIVAAAGRIPVFGGVAADQNELSTTQVFCNSPIEQANVVVVYFYGERLRILSHSYLGWVPFGEVLKITSVEQQKVITINDQPAYRLYHDYTGIEKDNFYHYALDFPFILNRDGKQIARVPSAVVDQDALICTGNIQQDDAIQFSYGNPVTIFSPDCYAEELFEQFQPDALMLFSCCIRMALLEEQGCNEIAPYQGIAPVMGIFTFGEVDSREYGGNVLNATLVTVGIKEYRADQTIPDLELDKLQSPRNQAVTIDNRLERLMNVVGRMTTKLYQANLKLHELTYIDPLTKAINRRAFHEQSEQCCRYAQAGGSCVVLLFDIDNFKLINDEYGHLIGDQVLMRLVELSQKELPAEVKVARYGGEEFVVILRDFTLAQAVDTAERLRRRIKADSQEQSLGLPAITCSFGVSASLPGDTVQRLISRADEQLYKAKRLGKNRVCS